MSTKTGCEGPDLRPSLVMVDADSYVAEDRPCSACCVSSALSPYFP